jgi:hypothetical protein
MKSKNPRKNMPNINKIINLGLTLIATSAIGYIALDSWLSKKSEITNEQTQINLEQKCLSQELREAIKDPKKRQTYLDRLLTNASMPFVSTVIYDSEGKKLVDYLRALAEARGIANEDLESSLEETKRIALKGEFDAKTPEIFDFSGEGIKPPIFIGKKLFTGQYSDLEIRTCIYAHEARHAEQIALGLERLGYLKKETILKAIKTGEIPQAVLYGVCEIDAMNSELTELEKVQTTINTEYYNRVLTNYRVSRRILEINIRKTQGNLRELLIKTLEVNPKR